MNPSELVILNGKINNVTGDVNRFWNTVAKVYKGNDKELIKKYSNIRDIIIDKIKLLKTELNNHKQDCKCHGSSD